MAGSPNSYQKKSFKASHNSYQRTEEVFAQIAWNGLSPANGGCRALEFDINRHSDGSQGASEGYFQVNHDRGGSGTTLASWLAPLMSLHLRDPRHEPYFVTLDIKSTQGNALVFPDEIDAYLGAWFDRSAILTPRDIMVDQNLTLLRNVTTHGWPNLDAMGGKFLFCLSGNKDWKQLYAKSGVAGRLCFADFDVRDDEENWSAPSDGNRAVVNINLFYDHHKTWRRTVPEMRNDGLLVRAYVLNGSKLWRHAFAAGFNILATDQITGKSWAHVGNTPFVAN